MAEAPPGAHVQHCESLTPRCSFSEGDHTPQFPSRIAHGQILDPRQWYTRGFHHQVRSWFSPSGASQYDIVFISYIFMSL